MTGAFAAEGFREIGRRFGRARLRRRLGAIDGRRRAAVAVLGRTAWEARLDLAAFAEFRDQIARLDARAGDLGAAARTLQGQVGVQRAKRLAEEDRFATALKPAASRHAEREAALRAARAAQGATADVQAITAEVQRAAEEVARIQSERNAALQPIDAELKRLEDELTRATRETVTVAREQQDRLASLGAALYEAGVSIPQLAEPRQAVARLDEERAGAQRALDASLARTGAMPRGTMAAFWAVFVVLPLAAVGVAFLLVHRGSGEPGGSATMIEQALRRRLVERTRSQGAIAADEARKDEVVQAFLRSPGDTSKRDPAMSVLADDVRLLGSGADRWQLPVLTKILKGGEPELREAAADAIGMIGPAASEVPPLLGALNDPVPAVRDAALAAIEQVRGNETTRVLARFIRASAASRSNSHSRRLEPESAPDARSLSVPIYPGAAFLFYASDIENGRAAFVVPDPAQKVIDFYSSRAGRPALDGREFSRAYFGATDEDPYGTRRSSRETDAWLRDAVQAKRPSAEIDLEAKRRGAAMQNLPLVRYADAEIYRSTRFVAMEEAASNGEKQAPSWVAVADAPVVGGALVEIHFSPRSR